MILAPFMKVDLAVKSYHERTFLYKKRVKIETPIQIKGVNENPNSN